MNFNKFAAFDDPPPKPDPCGMFFCILILKYCFLKKYLFLKKYKTLVIVFDFLLIPFLNFQEKLILSFKALILHIDITSCISQKVMRDSML